MGVAFATGGLSARRAGSCVDRLSFFQKVGGAHENARTLADADGLGPAASHVRPMQVDDKVPLAG